MEKIVNFLLTIYNYEQTIKKAKDELDYLVKNKKYVD